MDVTERIKELAKERNWTEYRLVKESGLPPSTIANIFHRGTLPGIFTLEQICQTFGISMSQFFNEDECVFLSNEQKELLECWNILNPMQKQKLLEFLKSLK